MNPHDPYNGLTNFHRPDLIAAVIHGDYGDYGHVRLPPNIVTLLKMFTDTALQEPLDNQHMAILVDILNELNGHLEDGLDRLETRASGIVAAMRGAPEGVI